MHYWKKGLLGWLSGKGLPANAGDASSIPGWGRSPGGGHSNPLQYSCQENPMDRGAWRATVNRVSKNWAWLKWLSMKHARVWVKQWKDTRKTSKGKRRAKWEISSLFLLCWPGFCRGWFSSAKATAHIRLLQLLFVSDSTSLLTYCSRPCFPALASPWRP